VLLTMFPAEGRAEQADTRSSHSVLDVAQLTHASGANIHERESQ
jgi:hypothetical protein